MKKLRHLNPFVIFSLSLVLIIPFFCENPNSTRPLCNFSFLINGVIFVIGVVVSSKKHSFSMNLIYWVFMLFFMYLAPLIQYRLNTYPWHTTVTEDEILRTNALVLVFNLFFVLGCFLGVNPKVCKHPRVGIAQWICSKWELKKSGKLILTLIVCLLTIYSLSQTGFSGIILSRSDALHVFYSGENTTLQLIVSTVIPAFMAYVVAEAAQSMVNREEKGLRFLLLLVCLLVCFFPTTIARYKAATIYGTICIVLFPKLGKGSRTLLLFIFGLFFAFPFLNVFRNRISIENIKTAIKNGFFETYTTGDYDAWRMIVSAIRYTDAYHCTYGRQLLGALLFFVPSSIWSSKPIGSGSILIQNELGSDAFSNVSCPFIAEGMINGGIIGVGLFALLLGFVTTVLDKTYWDSQPNSSQKVFSPYLFLVFLLFFILRGDLLSSFSYTCGFLCTGFLLKCFTTKHTSSVSPVRTSANS